MGVLAAHSALDAVVATLALDEKDADHNSDRIQGAVASMACLQTALHVWTAAVRLFAQALSLLLTRAFSRHILWSIWAGIRWC